MQFRFFRVLLGAMLLCFSVTFSWAQNSACPVFPEAHTSAGAPANMFSAAQEQWLGQVEAEVIEPSLDIEPPPFGDTYIDRVAAKLLATLPPSDLKYSFQIYESQELNSFGIAGGQIYLSSKMLTSFRNEDELAALLAHEIGHIATHQQAEEATRLFRKAGITQAAGDEKGIADQFRRVLASPTLKVKESKEETGQDVADQVAIYALTKAGYKPSAFADLFNRITGNQGKKGNAMLDLLGLTNENNRRYRAAAAMATAIPARCIAPEVADTKRFAAWQKHMDERDTEVAEEFGQDASVLHLNSPLGSDLYVIRFSPDGKLLLALDSNTVTVISRDASKVLFQIPAAHMVTAWFTPDSSAVTFVTASLRVEKWNIADHKRMEVYEPSFPDTCLQIFLATDGRSVACATVGDFSGLPAVGLTLLDTQNSAVLWQDKDVGAISNFMSWQAYTKLLAGLRENSLFIYAQSPDGHILLLGALDKTYGFDLATRQKLDLQGELKHIGYGHFAFVGEDQVIVENPQHPENSSLIAFPSGKLIKHLKLSHQQLIEVSRGNAVVLAPIKDAASGLYDLDKMKITASSQSFAMDLYDNELARQAPTGNLQLDDLSNPAGKSKIVDIPRRRLPSLWAASISPDGRYLAMSTATRGAIWDLKQNVRMAMVRPFDNAFFTADGMLTLDLAKYRESKRVVAQVNLTTKQGKETTVNPEDDDVAAAGILDRWKAGKGVAGTLQVLRATDGQVLWSRDFTEGLYRDVVGTMEPVVLCVWHLDSPGAKLEIKQHPELKSRADNIINKREGLVVERLNRENGALLDASVLRHEERSEATYKYVARTFWTVGDYVLVEGDDDRTSVYHMPDGVETTEFFGSTTASSAEHGWAAVINRDTELRVMNLGNGKELLRRLFRSPVRFVAFKKGTRELLVLTADNALHTLTIP